MYSLLLAFLFVLIEAAVIWAVWRLRSACQRRKSSASAELLRGEEAFALADRLVDVHSVLKKSTDKFSRMVLSAESAAARQSAQTACERSMEVARELAEDLAQLKRPGAKVMHSMFDGHLLTVEAMDKAFSALESAEKKLSALNQKHAAGNPASGAEEPGGDVPADAGDPASSSDTLGQDVSPMEAQTLVDNPPAEAAQIQA